MKADNFLKRFLNRLRPARMVNAEPASPKPILPVVLRMLAKTEEVELSCDEVFALLDQYTEMVQRGEDVAHLMPLVARHMQMCPDCLEEFEALQRILAAAPSE